MKSVTLCEIEECLSRLTPEERELLRKDLELMLNQGEGKFQSALEDKQEHEVVVCPHCGGSHIRKIGHVKGRQRYYCNGCGKTFGATTNTVMCKLQKPDLFMWYIGLVFERKTLKQCEEELHIAHQTAFDWRHKILSAMACRVPERIGGVVECDEMEVRESEKGSQHLRRRKPRRRGSDFTRNDGVHGSNVKQVVTAVSRTGRRVMVSVDGKKVTTAQLEDAIGDKVEDGCVFITDKNPAYCKFSKAHNLQHKRVLSTDHVDKSDRRIHIQHVNSTHNLFRNFIKRHVGVSSRYLANYLAWFAYMGDYEKSADKISALARDILCSAIPYAHYRKLKYTIPI